MIARLACQCARAGFCILYEKNQAKKKSEQTKERKKKM